MTSNTTVTSRTRTPHAARLRDDALLQLLGSGMSATEAAADIGCSVASVYRRLRQPAFRARLTAARADRYKPILSLLLGEMPNNLAVLRGIRDSLTAADGARIRAVDSLISATFKTIDLCDVMTRLEALEAALDDRDADGPDDGDDAARDDADARESTGGDARDDGPTA
jgi:hypothetical protein